MFEENKNNTNTYIGNRIKKRRLELGLSQGELAGKIGVSFQQVQKYEKGINRISADKFILLSDALNTTPSYFLPATENFETPASMELIAADGSLNSLIMEKIDLLSEKQKHALYHVIIAMIDG